MATILHTTTTTTTATTTTKKRQRAAAIAALVQRFEAARAAQHSAQLAADADALIAEGTVRDLIALFNGMARSVPDYPRAAYSRSKRAPRAVSASPAGVPPLAPVTIVRSETLPETPSRSTLDELVSVMGLSDDDSAAALEWLATNDDAELADLARECCCVDSDDEDDADTLTDDTNQLDETDDDDDNEVEEEQEQDAQSEPIETEEDAESNQEADDELSTCDDTASVYSLSSSCMSDCSFEDDASDASLYYERAFRVHCEAPPAAPQEPQEQEPQEKDEDEETPQPAAAVVVEPVTVALVELTPSAVETAPIETTPIKTPPPLLLLPASPVKDAELPTRIPILVGSSLRTPPSSPTKPPSAPRATSPKAPVAVLSMALTPVLTAPPAPVKPKRVPSPIKSAPVRSLYKTTPAPPASVITPRGAALNARVANNGASPARRRKRWEPTTPRKPVERPVCPRHAAAALASSPCKHATETKRPVRRNSMSDTKSRAPTSSLAALRTPAPGASSASSRPSGSAPAAPARIANAKVPPPSPKSLGRSTTTRTAASVVPPAPKSAPAGIASHVRSEPTRLRTRSHDIGARLSTVAPARQSVSTSAVAVAPAPTPEIRPSRIKSRLFDFEHDPKRLELIAANRARRRSVDFVTMQPV